MKLRRTTICTILGPPCIVATRHVFCPQNGFGVVSRISLFPHIRFPESRFRKSFLGREFCAARVFPESGFQDSRFRDEMFLESHFPDPFLSGESFPGIRLFPEKRSRIELLTYIFMHYNFNPCCFYYAMVLQLFACVGLHI